MASVGKFEIRARPGPPPAGLLWLPTVEPALSDDADTYHGRPAIGQPDVTECNLAIIREAISDALVIVEIGVAPEPASTSASVKIMAEKPPGSVYIGIDIANKTRFHDPANGVYIIHCDSKNRIACWDLMDHLHLDGIDVLFIDGLHSVNQCIEDWQYTKRLAPDGVVLLHDIHFHPGPAALLAALDASQWRWFDACPERDYGLAIIGRRND